MELQINRGLGYLSARWHPGPIHFAEPRKNVQTLVTSAKKEEEANKSDPSFPPNKKQRAAHVLSPSFLSLRPTFRVYDSKVSSVSILDHPLHRSGRAMALKQLGANAWTEFQSLNAGAVKEARPEGRLGRPKNGFLAPGFLGWLVLWQS